MPGMPIWDGIHMSLIVLLIERIGFE